MLTATVNGASAASGIDGGVGSALWLHKAKGAIKTTQHDQAQATYTETGHRMGSSGRVFSQKL